MVEELDVIALLQKIRISNDLWTNVLRKDQMQLLKRCKSGVIDLSDVDDDSSGTSSDEEDMNSSHSAIEIVD